MPQPDPLSDEDYAMWGTALVDAMPLPPGLDWDYFQDDKGEMSDTENPAVDAVFDMGFPLVGAWDGGVEEDLFGPLLSVGEDYEICERQ